jgi:hypothetical protein
MLCMQLLNFVGGVNKCNPEATMDWHTNAANLLTLFTAMTCTGFLNCENYWILRACQAVHDLTSCKTIQPMEKPPFWVLPIT